MLVKFQPLHVTPQLSATRKLSKNGVVGARSDGRWELSGFPTLTQWRKGCRGKRSASRAERVRLRTPAISERLGRGGPQGLAYDRGRNPHPFPAEPSGTQNTRKTRKGCGT